MLNPHVSVAIAQVVVYAPMLPIAIYVLCKNWKYPPRMAWYPIVTFCLLRIAGGIISIVRGDNTSNTNLIIADIVILGVGTIPLIVALIGLVRILFILSLEATSRANYIIKLIHLVFLAAVVLFVVGGVMNSGDSPGPSARIPSRVSYILLAVLLVIAVGALSYLIATQYTRIPRQCHHIIYFCLLAAPFIAVRIAYGILGAFNSIYSTWDPVFGSALAFGLMCLLPEFIAICIFIHLGFYSIKHRGNLPQTSLRSDDSQYWGRRRRRRRRGGPITRLIMGFMSNTSEVGMVPEGRAKSDV